MYLGQIICEKLIGNQLLIRKIIYEDDPQNSQSLNVQGITSMEPLQVSCCFYEERLVFSLQTFTSVNITLLLLLAK